ncbi:hypothetical protein DJ568_15175 [Mucilaginibacter hurinus]|uniref:Uncharacterized protein n=1 Tax=Mucilaginibacter hurinus TaxID=2201324 RepID=A0A367GKN2_9SPHI|nr:hypothetical protein DJ568_15175 [Mucilaginibacter hurinus]
MNVIARHEAISLDCSASASLGSDVCHIIASGCTFSFSAKEKVPKRKLPAAPDPVKVSANALPMLPVPADAGFCGELLFVRLYILFCNVFKLIKYINNRHCEERSNLHACHTCGASLGLVKCFAESQWMYFFFFRKRKSTKKKTPGCA